MNFVFFTPICSVIGLLTAFLYAKSILKLPEGTPKMIEISNAVKIGAKAYLKSQYKVVATVFGIIFLLLLLMMLTKNLPTFVPFAFLSGGFWSALSGYIGMTIATNSSARTANAAKDSLNKSLRVAFSSGSVMGLTVVGLGLMDLSIWYFILKYYYGTVLGYEHNEVIQWITRNMVNFSMGASLQALFARAGGGIFTKAADVGADLVGKIEAGIPEDDPRNPAVIADNVGDNVGDVAGMGADLYESYVGSIVAAMALGAAAFLDKGKGFQAATLPLVFAGFGLLCSIIGGFLVRTEEKTEQRALLKAFRIGIYSATILVAIISLILVLGILGKEYIGIWVAILVGLIAGNVIGFVTEYYTSDNYGPTKRLSEQANTGPATVIIGGISLGMLSTAIPVLTVVIAILLSYFASGGGKDPEMGLYGIGLAAVGMLSTLGITLATDAYGPVADNAGGNAEMSGLGEETRNRTDALDALGNTTAATGKGFAIGSAALTALALLAAYRDVVKKILGDLSQVNISLMNPKVICGLFIGACIPFLFSAFTMAAVGRTAGKIVEEVRRQFREKKGIMDGTEKPDYARCVTISTQGAQKEMMVPSLLAILVPLAIGFFGGVEMTFALLAGTISTGFVLAVMMANSGAAWDNAKKFIEKSGLKKTDKHKASVIGDTVGDPFKDTSGPSLNILIKLMSIVSIVLAEVIIKYSILK
jgi:K(+)-stimulated pyrophosphate-energized sodium pump